MYKIMELLLGAQTTSQLEILNLLINEEFEKRNEDKSYIKDEVGGFRGSAVEVLTHEITDKTVAYFLKQQFQRLREVYDMEDAPPPVTTEEPE